MLWRLQLAAEDVRKQSFHVAPHLARFLLVIVKYLLSVVVSHLNLDYRRQIGLADVEDLVEGILYKEQYLVLVDVSVVEKLLEVLDTLDVGLTGLSDLATLLNELLHCDPLVSPVVSRLNASFLLQLVDDLVLLALRLVVWVHELDLVAVVQEEVVHDWDQVATIF